MPERTSRPPISSRSAWRHVAATLAIFLASLGGLGWEASVAGFEADEADYVATSRYFGYLFLQRDVTRKEWDGNHWTRTQPPLTRYIVGAWLTAYGYDLEKMNQPYVSTASSFEINRQKGRVPTDEVLARSRQPMVLLGAAAIALLYPLGLLLGGSLAGAAAAALALTSPFLRYTLVHTWAEAPLACFLLLAAILAATGLRRLLDGRASPLGWGIGLGVALGLASATKLTGLVGIPIVLGVAGLMATLAWRAGERARARRLIVWAGLATVVALALVVIVNPFLWRGPVAGLASMVEQRRDEMTFQQEQWPEFAVLSVAERPWLMAVGLTRIGPWGDLPAVAAALGLGLAAFGLWSVRRRLTAARPEPATLMLLAWLGGYAVAIFGGLGLSYPRYFLPACILLLPLIGAGAAALVTAVASAVRGARATAGPSVSAASSARSR
ncbi:MAG: hypothetical protein IT306_03440 [Chloroflexi bacterium]|nr:hypothetical protein [Chloroflexota bacterium]